jgi:hypothetical protein
LFDCVLTRSTGVADTAGLVMPVSCAHRSHIFRL